MRSNASITSCRLNWSCASYDRSCLLHPPHTPKCLHLGATRRGEGVRSSTALASAKFFPSFLIFALTTSPGTAFSTKNTSPSCRATVLPSPERFSTFSVISSPFSMHSNIQNARQSQKPRTSLPGDDHLSYLKE